MERVRVALGMMVFIHLLHLFRLIFTVVTKYSSRSSAIRGCLRCLLIDCYCCAGTFVYLYTQIAFFLDLHECKEELPNIKPHMRHEIYYQWIRVLWYFLSNLLVVLYILNIQRKFDEST